jgi:quercetin dioxygenase-like cupin family protein
MASSVVVAVHPDRVKWEQVQELPGCTREELEGHEFGLLRVDEDTGGLTALVRYGPGFREPRQSHTYGHAVFVVRGTIYDANTGETLVPAGGYWYAPAGDVHGPFSFAPDTLVFFTTDGPRDFILEE